MLSYLIFSMTKKKKKPKIIGRIETCTLKDLGMKHIPSKIDTGAYTSSIHCKKVKLVDNKLYCLFKGSKKTKNYMVFDEYSYRAVRSSNGISEMRYFIKTKIKIANKVLPIQLSLTDRKQMRYKLLIGRKFLSKRFIVDVSQKFVISNS